MGKTPVIGVKERGGNVVATVVDNADKKTAEGVIDSNISEDAVVNTDESLIYSGVSKKRRHVKVNHSAKLFVDGMASTNGNELRMRGFSVDVGIVPVQIKELDGKYTRKQFEVDFVANQGSKRFYVQSAFRMGDEEKSEQENRSLRRIDDSFKKIIVVGDGGLLWRNNDGHLIINVMDFLLNPDSLDL